MSASIKMMVVPKRADKTPSIIGGTAMSLIVGPQFCYVHVEGFAQKQQSEGMYRWLASSFALASYVGWQPEYACY
jgi:hypothetical protein